MQIAESQGSKLSVNAFRNIMEIHTWDVDLNVLVTRNVRET